MSSLLKGLVSLVAAAALAVSLVGCTDATDIDPGNHVVKFVPVATNASGVTFDCVLVDFSAMRIAPVDPLALDPLGATPQIAVLRQPLQRVSFLESPCGASGVNTLPELILPAGEYTFTALAFEQFSFEDGSDFPPSCFAPANYLESGPSPTIVVGPGRANVIAFELDIEAIIDDYNSSNCINFFFDPRSFISVSAS